MLLFHLSLQGVHLIEFLHDRVVIRIIRPQQFTQFNVVQFQIRTGLDGSFLRIYADLVQASHLVVREAQILAHTRILSHAQEVLAATESAVAAALPTHPFPPAPARPPLPAEIARAPSGKLTRAATPLVLTAPTKLMLALRWAGPLWGTILTPADNHGRHQTHNPQNPNRHFPTHVQTSSCYSFGRSVHRVRYHAARSHHIFNKS
jgi:hypothetical protein